MQAGKGVRGEEFSPEAVENVLMAVGRP